MILYELTAGGVCLRLLCALILGGIIGLERELRNRGAGLRTYILVCMGACVVMLTNLFIYQTCGTGDPVRMGAQVISGIGFLGAGTILTGGSLRIQGLTTAAGLWLAGCIGLACGAGFYLGAALCGVIAVLALNLLHPAEARLQRGIGRVEVYVELRPGASLGEFFALVRENEIRVSSYRVESGCAPDRVAFRAGLRREKRRSGAEDIPEILRRAPLISCIERCS